jgi:hypothetical protein
LPPRDYNPDVSQATDHNFATAKMHVDDFHAGALIFV